MSGIYIHIPFCKSKCAYCNFFSLVSEKKINDYVNSLKREIVSRKDYLGGEKVKTIYFGGGTPSLLPTKYIDEILKIINNNFDLVSNPEITLEANPDTIDKEQLFELKSLGVNRISVGIQSFHDDDLKYLDRKHDSKHALQIIDDLKCSIVENFRHKNAPTDRVRGIFRHSNKCCYVASGNQVLQN